jgi:hypothetical protein
MKSNILIKVCSFGVALLLGGFAFFYGSNVIASEPVTECHAKVCNVDNKLCVCCLIADGSITCSPCGGMSCD